MVVTSNATPPETPVAQAPVAKPSVWQKLNPVHWFGTSAPAGNYTQGGVTPLSPIPEPAPAVTSTAAEQVPAAPVKLAPPAPPVFPLFAYRSPPAPKAGDRKAAAAAFAAAQQSEQKLDWAAAMNSYQKAAQLDPSWFEAQYNYAVLANRQREFSHSLAASELALALQPDSADARYNFALALKSSG